MNGRFAGSVGGPLPLRPSRSGPFVGSIPVSRSFARAALFGTAASRRLSIEGSLPLPSKVSIKKPCQYFYRSCKTADRQTATLTGFGKAPADVNAIPSRHLSPIAKLVFYALATKACGTNRTIWMSDGAIARRCGVSRPSVISGMRQLLAVGLVEKVGLPVNQVQAYRICHPMFGSGSGRTEISDSAGASRSTPTPLRSCGSCHRPCNRLTRAGVCRGCKAEMDLAARVKEVRAELGPDASPEQVAQRLEQIAEERGRRRLSARVRRVMEAVA